MVYIGHSCLNFIICMLLCIFSYVLGDASTTKQFDARSAIFDPSGRLLQVEYASSAASLGGVIIGLSSKEYVVILSWSLSDKFAIRERRIKAMNSGVCVVTSGVIADCMHIEDFLFNKINEHEYIYGSKFPLRRLGIIAADYVHEKTMSKFDRPLGCRVCMAGYDEIQGAMLLEIDPLGNFYHCRSMAIGPYAEKLHALLRASSYQDSPDSMVKTCVSALKKCIASLNIEQQQETKSTTMDESSLIILRPQDIEVAVVGRSLRPMLIATEVLKDMLD